MRDQAHVADLDDHALELLEILAQQKHPLLVVLADLLEDEDALAIGAGGDQTRHDGLIETILGGEA